MSGIPLVVLGGILLAASIVAILSRRLHFPYSVGLVLAGMVLALLPVSINVPLSRELLFTFFLPPLIFQAAIELKWRYFRRNLPATLLLAFPGVALAGAVVAVGTHYLLGWSWIGAGLFGVLIAATDPVSVIAAFREMKAQPRLSLLVESESLLNDGAAAVGFGVLVAIAEGAQGTPLSVAGSLMWTVIGGVVAGGAVAGTLLTIAGRTEDHLVEITLTTLAAYGSFLLAEHFGMSGVLATLTAGLLVGNLGWRGAISQSGRGHVLAFWEYAAFLANSIIFILLTLLGRAAAVYPLCALLRPTALRIEAGYQHVLVWGGLRGALALALALALPASLPERGEIIVVAFAVVAFSIFVQGLTMPWLTRRLGLVGHQGAKPPELR
jgi:CPA1 family monovalent cation:H+ antiporter